MDNRFITTVVPGTITERISLYFQESEKRGVIVNDNIRKFVSAGFMLQEIGGGVIDSLVGMENNGELEGLSNADKARVLISLLQRVASEPGMVRSPAPVQEPVVKADPKPEAEPEQPPVKKELKSFVMDLSQ